MMRESTCKLSFSHAFDLLLLAWDFFICAYDALTNKDTVWQQDRMIRDSVFIGWILLRLNALPNT